MTPTFVHLGRDVNDYAPRALGEKKRSRKKAGHRTWAAKGKPVPGVHVGDIMSREVRSRVMGRIRGKHTKPEIVMAKLIMSRGLEFEQHASDLPGRPDFVFRRSRLAVFVDGDFWHGWRFPLWRHKLAPKWSKKIDDTRARDQQNFRKLRRNGWKVLRLWEHEIEQAPARCLSRVLKHLNVLEPMSG